MHIRVCTIWELIFLARMECFVTSDHRCLFSMSLN